MPLGIVCYDAGFNPEFDPTMMDGTIEDYATLEFACGGDFRR
jgi:hypothetical protein